MKNKFLRNLSLLALSLILVISLSACGSNMDNNSDNYVSSNDSETPLESELMPSQNNNSANNSETPNSSGNNNQGLNETAKITKEEAKKIALKDAGATENEIRDFEIELDRDNDILKYEISFEKGNDDYDYDIDANTGKIINKEKDINN